MTTPDLLDLYRRASEWSSSVASPAAKRLDAATPCEGWDVRTLFNHMVQTQRYFAGSARGEDVSLSPDPPDLVGDDPIATFDRACGDVLSTFADPAVIDKTGPSLGIAFSDLLLHTWDLATATGQDATMPDGLPDAAYGLVHGKFTDEQRKGVFAPEIPVAASASPQERLLAYTGRDPYR
jgi:uncharacterized protein (TIGR03086 family)